MNWVTKLRVLKMVHNYIFRFKGFLGAFSNIAESDY